MAGSIGKKTNIVSSDMDCVLFLNDEEPPFDDIMNCFYEIFVDSPFNEVFTIRKNKFAVQFKNDNFKLDLVPAPNFTGNKKHIDLQQKIALERIMENPKVNCYVYSSALAEATVDFMERRVGFANDMARIAKFWFKSCSFDGIYISGASTFIELVAVFAARHGQRGPRKYNSYLKCFIRFLLMLIRFDELNVEFPMGNSVFREHLQFMDDQRPCVIDPVNPYNNLARNWKSDAQDLIANYAEATFERLQDLVVHSTVPITMDHLIGELF